MRLGINIINFGIFLIILAGSQIFAQTMEKKEIERYFKKPVEITLYDGRMVNGDIIIIRDIDFLVQKSQDSGREIIKYTDVASIKVIKGKYLGRKFEYVFVKIVEVALALLILYFAFTS